MPGLRASVHRARFRAFAERKTAAALAASPEGFLTEFDEAAGVLEAIGNDWSRRLFDGAFYMSPSLASERPACSLVFVQSRDGNTGASDPAALGGGATDTHVIYEGLAQVAADGVLAGAETVRGADLVFAVWHPELVRLREVLGKPRYPTQIVATLRGLSFDDCLLFNAPDIPVVVLTVASGARRMRDGFAARPWVRPLVLSHPSDLSSAFRGLRSLGIGRVSAIGGRHLATQLIDAGLIQDVYLTTSPRSGGEHGTPMYPRPLPGRCLVRKRGKGSETGVIFEHLGLDPVV